LAQIAERFPDMASMVKQRLLLTHEAERLAKVTIGKFKTSIQTYRDVHNIDTEK
jgi:hypothetical protein